MASWGKWLMTLCGESAELLSPCSTLFSSENLEKPQEEPKLNPKCTLKKPWTRTIWKCSEVPMGRTCCQAAGNFFVSLSLLYQPWNQCPVDMWLVQVTMCPHSAVFWGWKSISSKNKWTNTGHRALWVFPNSLPQNAPNISSKCFFPCEFRPFCWVMRVNFLKKC